MLNLATVIIPCFNVGKYITECLESVKEQDWVHKTLVVDNNSHDDTIAQVKAWQRKHPNFPLTLLHENNQGAPAARNAALSFVETKWVQFLDADDLLLPNKISDQIKLYPNADVICGGASLKFLDGKEDTTTPEENIPLALIKGNAGNTCSNLFSASSLQTIQGWDETLKSSQEYDLMFRLWKAGASFSIDSTPRALIRQRVHGQISTSNRQENLKRYLKLREQMLQEFKERGVLTNQEVKICLQQIFDSLRILAKSDLTYAIKLHSRIYPKTFQPAVNATNSQLYIHAYKLFGFRLAEKIKKWVTNCFYK